MTILAVMAFILSCVSLGWNVMTYLEKQRIEAAEKAKRADLRLTLHRGNNRAEYYPVGGHMKPCPVSFSIAVENLGKAKADDVVVTVDLPAWVHGAKPEVYTYPAAQPDGSWQVVALESNETNLPFKMTGQGEVAYAALPRPMYVGVPQEVGLVTVLAPAGSHRFDWRIESSAGIVVSDDKTAIYITLHDTAVGHTAVKWDPQSGADRANCPECQRLANMTPEQIAAILQQFSQHM